MKMILWVEDEISHIQKVFGDKLEIDSEDDQLLEKYHVHRVDNLDDALTAVSERDYDYYLLDIKFPDYDKDNVDQDDNQIKRNKSQIDRMVADDNDVTNFEEMRAGQYLFMYLLQSKDVDQLCIYSGNIGHATALKRWVEESGIILEWDKVIFNKTGSSEIDQEQASEAVLKKVYDWIMRIASNKERILRHAMMEGCDTLLSSYNNGKLRPLYPRMQRGPEPKTINKNKIKNHIKLIHKVVKEVGNTMVDYDFLIYHSLLIMIITSECQEQLYKDHTYQYNDNIKREKVEKTIELDDDFKRLAGVLVRVRNLFEHHKKINPSNWTDHFVAMLFLVFARSRCDFGDDLAPFEKEILKLFEGNPQMGSGSAYADLVTSIVDVRCGKLKVKPRSYFYVDRKTGKLKTQGWNIPDQKNRDKKEYAFQDLLENRKFMKDFYQYEPKQCYQLFMVNFFDYGDRHEFIAPAASFDESEIEKLYKERNNKPTRAGWKISEPQVSGKPAFSNKWYDKFVMAFYQEAIPSGKKKT